MKSLRELLAHRKTPSQASEGDSTDESALASRLEEENRRLTQMKHSMECPRCSGRNKQWPCLNDPQYAIKANRIARGLPLRAWASFETYRVPPGDRKALAKVQGWAQKPEGWLTVVGEPGTGKTHLALAAAEMMVEQNHPCNFWQIAEMLDEWRRLYRDERDPDEWWHHFVWPVVLDDLGAERPTEWAVEKLGQFLDWRYRERYPTLITTNLTEDQLRERLNHRIADRTYDTGSGLVQVVPLLGKSFRTGR